MSEQRLYKDATGQTEATVEVLSLAELQYRQLNAGLPFATLTQKNWMEVRERVPLCFDRFVQAITDKQVDVALMAGLELQEIATQMLLEVYMLTADLGLINVEYANLPS